MRSAAGISQESNRRGHAPQRGTVGRVLLSRVQRRIRVPAPHEKASADFLKRRNDHAPPPLHSYELVFGSLSAGSSGWPSCPKAPATLRVDGAELSGWRTAASFCAIDRLPALCDVWRF